MWAHLILFGSFLLFFLDNKSRRKEDWKVKTKASTTKTRSWTKTSKGNFERFAWFVGGVIMGLVGDNPQRREQRHRLVLVGWLERIFGTPPNLVSRSRCGEIGNPCVAMSLAVVVSKAGSSTSWWHWLLAHFIWWCGLQVFWWWLGFWGLVFCWQWWFSDGFGI